MPKQQPWMEELRMSQIKKEPNQEPAFGNKQLKPVLRKVSGLPSQSSNGASPERPPLSSRPSNIPNVVIPTSSARTPTNNGSTKSAVPQQRTSPLTSPQAKTAPGIYDRIQPFNDQERPIDEEIIHLRQRVTTLESTVATLQKELLQMKKLLERNGQPIVHL